MHMKGPFYYPPGLVGLGIAMHDVLVAILVNELTLDQVQHIFVVPTLPQPLKGVTSVFEVGFLSVINFNITGSSLSPREKKRVLLW